MGGGVQGLWDFPQKYVSENVGISPIPPYKTRFFRLWRITILILRETYTKIRELIRFCEKL